MRPCLSSMEHPVILKLSSSLLACVGDAASTMTAYSQEVKNSKLAAAHVSLLPKVQVEIEPAPAQQCQISLTVPLDWAHISQTGYPIPFVCNQHVCKRTRADGGRLLDSVVAECEAGSA